MTELPYPWQWVDRGPLFAAELRRKVRGDVVHVSRFADTSEAEVVFLVTAHSSLLPRDSSDVVADTEHSAGGR